ncbi:MAG: penicillin-binding protein 2 [Planctomycetes bacterium]|nr:penicillin-binding protein 2 [Planctomycetota bacterium]
MDSETESSKSLEPAHFWARALLTGFAGSFLLLLGRLFYLQCWPDERLERLAARQHHQRVELPGRRGNIFDRRGRLLVTTLEGYSVYVDPAEVESLSFLIEELGDCLDLDVGRLREKLEGRSGARFVWIRRMVSEKEIRRLWDRMTESPGSESFRGVHLTPEMRRGYPMGNLAGQLLGFIGTDGRGLEGIEAHWDNELQGQDGYQVVQRDVRGRRVLLPGLSSMAPAPGHSLHLTLDATVQQIVEEQLAKAVAEYHPKGAWALATDPWTGDVLAMASEPAFDPARRGEYSEAELKRRCRNPVVADFFEPGSTLKPFIIAAGLSDGLIDIGSVFHCGNGVLHLGRRVLHDHHPYGRLTVAEILEKSSNVGTAQIGLRVGSDRMHAYLAHLGFGQRTGIDFPGEAEGILRPLSQWTDYSVPSLSIGQEISVTPVQMAMAFGAIANGGVLMRPRLVRRIVDAGGRVVRELPVRPVRQVYPAQVVRGGLTSALCGVVEEGTGTASHVEGYRIAGKTGTSQKLLAGGRGYSHSEHLASFVAFAPAEQPRLLVYLGVDEPRGAYYGGQVAAPYVGEILRQALTTLHVPPTTEVATR